MTTTVTKPVRNQTELEDGICSEQSIGKLPGSSQRGYETPILHCYGDVRDITLGPTLGEGESGCAGIFRPGPGGCPGP